MTIDEIIRETFEQAGMTKEQIESSYNLFAMEYPQFAGEVKEQLSPLKERALRCLMTACIRDKGLRQRLFDHALREERINATTN